MDVNKLLGDLTELMEEAEAETARGGRLHKAGANAHGTTKADHHEKMAEVCAKMADLHASMSDHYKTGAKGAHATKAAKVDDGGDDDADVEETTKEDAKKSTGYGALDSIRSRPSRKREGVSRTELNEMFSEFGENLLSTLVKVLTPPPDREPTGDELAAAKLLRAQGYEVHLPENGGSRGAALDVSKAADKGKVDTDAAKADAQSTDTKIAILKAKISALEANVISNPTAAAEAAGLRAELDALAKASIREALGKPHVAASGQLAGLRGHALANQ